MLIVAFLIAIVIVAIYAHRYRDRRLCRWRESRSESKGALVKYTCVTCGAEAYRAEGKPDRCLANLTKPGL
jgi:hypothetical protein